MEGIAVSVIVPVYNRVELLDAFYETLARQTLRNLEFVLVDDGSTDGTGPALDRLAARDDRVKVLHQENAGTGAARNAGIAAAAGRFVAFLDSDDSFAAPESSASKRSIMSLKSA